MYVVEWKFFLSVKYATAYGLSFKCQHPSPYNSNSQTKEVPHDFYNNSKRHYRKYWSVASFLMTTPKHFLSSTTWHCGTHSLVSLDFSRLLQMESLLVGYGAQCTVSQARAKDFAFSFHLIGRLSRIKTAWLECRVLRNKQRHMTSLV